MMEGWDKQEILEEFRGGVGMNIIKIHHVKFWKEVQCGGTLIPALKRQRQVNLCVFKASVV